MSAKPAVTLRKPKAVNTNAAEAFVNGPPAVPAIAPVASTGPASPSAGRTRRKVAVADLERVNAYVPKDTMTAVRVRCATERLSLSDVVTRALAQWLAEAAPKKKK